MDEQTQKALKMAIDALEEAKEQLGGLPALDKLIQDCKEALATNKESSLVQPEQEPDYWLGYGLQAYDEKPHDDATPVYLRPAPQPAQEPFGYFKAEPFGWTDCAEDDEGAIALYEKPAQAETDKEKILNNLKNAIANDSIAISFQSMASYRKFLICYMNFWLKQGEKNANE